MARPALRYSRDTLLSLRYAMSPRQQLLSALSAINRLNRNIHQRRPRRKRSGRKRYKIKVLTNFFGRYIPDNQGSTPVSVNFSNLIQVKRQPKPSRKHLSCTLWNARSIDKKLPAVADAIIQNGTDIFIVAETWFNALDATIKARFSSSIDGYNIHQIPRTCRKGGGVSVIVKKNLKFSVNTTSSFKTFEVLDRNMNLASSTIRLIVIYRPPYSHKSCKWTVTDFLDEFATVIEGIIHARGHLVIAGDFNIHTDDPSNNDATHFNDLLHSFGLEQHIKFPTHDKGHTLIITRTSDVCVHNFTSDWLLPSDHASLHFDIPLNRPDAFRVTRTSRRLNNLNIEVLQDRVSSLFSELPSDSDHVNELAANYNYILTSILNEFAPPITKVHIEKERVPWFTVQFMTERKNHRRLERQWQKSGLAVHKDIFRSARCAYFTKVHEAHTNYLRDRIDGADQRSLFNVIDDIIGGKKVNTEFLPDLDICNVPDTFVNFFCSKIAKLRESLPVATLSETYNVNLCCSFDAFTTVTIDYVSKLINTLPPKSCLLDLFPSTLLKECSVQIAPVICQIINSSPISGEFPSSCKPAIVRPLLKKANLDKTSLRITARCLIFLFFPSL
ncbi:uncharacterized protein LOC144434304 [Glandiceps talaboti]